MGKVADKRKAELHREMIGEEEYSKWSEEALKFGKVLYTGLRYAGVSSSRKPWEKLPELERLKWGEAALNINNVVAALSGKSPEAEKTDKLRDLVLGTLERISGAPVAPFPPDFLKAVPPVDVAG